MRTERRTQRHRYFDEFTTSCYFGTMPLGIPTREELDRLRAATHAAHAHSFAAVEEQVAYVVAALNVWRPSRKLSKYEWALLVHLGCASYTVVHGVVQLCEALAGDLAAMLVRSLYETMLSAYWMSIQPVERADVFDCFVGLENVQLNQLLMKLDVIEESELPPHHRDPAYVEALHAAFPHWIRGWTGKKLEKLEADVKTIWPKDSAEEFERFTETARKIGNRLSHVSASDMTARIKVNEDGAEVTLGPMMRSQLWVPLALKLAAWFYGQLADLVIEHAKITDLSRWRAHFRRSMLRTKVLTPEATRGVGSKDPCPCGSGFKFGRCHGR